MQCSRAILHFSPRRFSGRIDRISKQHHRAPSAFACHACHGYKKEPGTFIAEDAGQIPGGDLLSQDLSSQYHRRCSVSLPGSEWDRVVPPRSGHQRAVLHVSGPGLWLSELGYHRLRVRSLHACSPATGFHGRSLTSTRRNKSFFTTSIRPMSRARSLEKRLRTESSRTDD